MAIFVYKHSNNKLPPLFDGFYMRNASFHGRETRYKNMYRMPMTKSVTAEKFITKTGVQIWNELNQNSSTDVKIGEFKKVTKKFLLLRYDLI